MAIVRRPSVLLAVAAILTATIAARAYAPATDPQTVQTLASYVRPCAIPAELARFEHPLPRLTQRVAAGAPVRIVAIGSSSTYGEGASAPEASYPSRLAHELARHFPGATVTVINRGVNGDTDHDMLARFEEDVIAERPDVVIWQLGTNSMLNGDPMDEHLPVMHGGIKRLQETGADVVLLDPQFAPAVTEGGEAGTIVDLIAQAARGASVNLFRRFELMRRWREVERMSFAKFLADDEFHMNDWSYACVAQALGTAMAEAAMRSTQVAAR